MSKHPSLSDGHIQIRISEDRLPELEEVIREGQLGPQGRRSGFSLADVMLPLMQKWSRNPDYSIRSRISGKSCQKQIEGRAKWHKKEICKVFVSKLPAHERRGASAILRGLLYEYLDQRKREVEEAEARHAVEQTEAAQAKAAEQTEAAQAKAAERAKAAQAKAAERAKVAQKDVKAAYMRDLRKALKRSIADGIAEFLGELSKQHGPRYKGRSLQRMDRDAAALVKLGERVAEDLAIITAALVDQKHGHARGATHRFADDFVKKLGFSLSSPFSHSQWGKQEQPPKFGKVLAIPSKLARFS